MTRIHVNFVRALLRIGLSMCFTAAALGVPKPHVVGFGRWISVQVPGGNAEEKPVAVKVRPLLVDTRVKEFTLGPVHEITERLFVVQRAFRVNDSLPPENAAAPQWRWERGGWLMVDRVSGRVSTMNLPEFDVDYSSVSWYRYYAAYCGVSDDGKRVYAVVAQVSRRKPVLKQTIEGKRAAESNPSSELTGPACSVRNWERRPVRVTFDLPGSSKMTFAVRGHVADVISEEEDSEEAAR